MAQRAKDLVQQILAFEIGVAVEQTALLVKIGELAHQPTAADRQIDGFVDQPCAHFLASNQLGELGQLLIGACKQQLAGRATGPED